MIELDIFLSHDQEIIVIHDDTLNRTTNGTGYVWEHTLPQLKKLDAGSWFSPKFKNLQIPTLQEVFDAIGKKILLNVEIKFEKGGALQAYPIEQKVIDLILKNNLLSSVIVSSFDYQILRTLRALDPNILLGVLSNALEKNLDQVALCKAIQAISYHPNCKHLTKTKITELHQAGIKVLPWALPEDNTPVMIQKMLSLKADGFFANDPALMKQIIQNKIKND
jgi:glycerophosphoryl diester phosphodiesterase